jgi:saccharopine dehydrogenase-like NADP-dependent oxidoreductase
MVVLLHQLDIVGEDGREERVTSTLVTEGDADFTAMAKTVGLPTALATNLLLNGELTLTGSLIPTHPAVYRPVLEALESDGLAFAEARAPVVAGVGR